MRRDRSVAQIVNVTTLPGVYGAALGMPDMHEGYGFPIGGVAATLLPDGAISPGGIGSAKIETYDGRAVCVHRKGATRAFGPRSADLPPAYRGVGQPVLIPGSMGTASFVLVGTDQAAALSLGSSCHGAGRAMSRSAAKRTITGRLLRRELEERGIVVRCPSDGELAEETTMAYKDIERVVNVVHAVGIARKVARLRPLGVVKG